MEKKYTQLILNRLSVNSSLPWRASNYHIIQFIAHRSKDNQKPCMIIENEGFKMVYFLKIFEKICTNISDSHSRIYLGDKLILKMDSAAFEIQRQSASLTHARSRQNHSTRVFRFALKFCKTLVIRWYFFIIICFWIVAIQLSFIFSDKQKVLKKYICEISC